MDTLTLTFYRSGLTRRHRWRLTHQSNGEKIAQSSQGRGFSRVEDCEHNACLTLSGPNGEIRVGDGRFVLMGRPDVEVVYLGPAQA